MVTSWVGAFVRVSSIAGVGAGAFPLMLVSGAVSSGSNSPIATPSLLRRPENVISGGPARLRGSSMSTEWRRSLLIRFRTGSGGPDLSWPEKPSLVAVVVTTALACGGSLGLRGADWMCSGTSSRSSIPLLLRRGGWQESGSEVVGRCCIEGTMVSSWIFVCRRGEMDTRVLLLRPCAVAVPGAAPASGAKGTTNSSGICPNASLFLRSCLRISSLLIWLLLSVRGD